MRIHIITLILDDILVNMEFLRRQLTEESSFITEYIVRELKMIKGLPYLGCERLNLICKTDDIKPSITKFNSIWQLDVLFDMSYFSFEPKQKREYLYHLIYEALQSLVLEMQMDFTPFQLILDKLKQNDFMVDFYTKCKCKKGNYTARLYCVQNMKTSTFYVEITRKKALVCKVPLFDTKPNIMNYDRYLGELLWDDQEVIFLVDKNKQVFQRLNIMPYISKDE